MPFRVGIVTVSDRASRGEYADRGGPAVRAYLFRVLATSWEAVARVVPDEREVIAGALRALCDQEGCALVVTTGGTGPAPRDVTPEATADVCDRLLPGFGEQMRAVSLSRSPPRSCRGRPPVCAAALWSSTFPGGPAPSRRVWLR